MAFETFLQQEQRRPSRRRAVGSIVAVAAHLLALGILVQGASGRRKPSDRPLVVVFRPASLLAPRTPPPAPAPSAPSLAAPAAETRAHRPPRRPTTQPRAQTRQSLPPAQRPRPPIDKASAAAPAESPTAAAAQVATAEPTAAVAGAEAGPPGAPAGPSPPASASAAVRPPRFLPEALANLQRLAGAAPDFPPSLAGAGASYLVQARVCVHPNGQVDSITLLRSAHPILDANVRAAVGKWRYRPLLVAGAPVPFCTLLRFEFRAI